MAMSEWSLNNAHHEDSTPGLSEELLQDEETLLSFMMDHSLRSPFKQSEATKKVKSKTRTNTKKKLPRSSPPAVGGSHPESSELWTNSTGDLSDDATKPFAPDSRPSKSEKGAAKLPTDRKGTGEVKKAAKKGSVLKAGEPHPGARGCVSKEEEEEDEDEEPPRCAQPEPSPAPKVPDSVGSPKTVVRFKLPKESRGPRRSQPPKADGAGGAPLRRFDAETDGYFSDAEMSDSDGEPRRAQRGQLDAASEDIVRMSILAS